MHFIVDGTNVANKKDGSPRALLEAEAALRAAYPDAQVTIVVDRAWIGWVRRCGTPADVELVNTHGDQGDRRWNPQPAGTEADDYILNLAHNRGCIVVSEDGFADYQRKYPFITEPGRRIVPVYLDNTWSWLTTNGAPATPAQVARKIEREAAKRAPAAPEPRTTPEAAPLPPADRAPRPAATPRPASTPTVKPQAAPNPPDDLDQLHAQWIAARQRTDAALAESRRVRQKITADLRAGAEADALRRAQAEKDSRRDTIYVWIIGVVLVLVGAWWFLIR